MSTIFKLISKDQIQKTLETLSELKPRKKFDKNDEITFTTYHFIEAYEKLYPKEWANITATHPIHQGKKFTARTIVARALGMVNGQSVAQLPDRIQTKPEWAWGNTWVHGWRIITQTDPVEISGDEYDDDAEDIDSSEIFQNRVDQARQNKDLDDLVREGVPRLVETRQTTTTTFKRRPEVVAWVVNNALECELCASKSFKNIKGEPYLEVHHVIPLSQNGPDEISNTVALCPSCHRELHFGKDQDKRRDELYAKVDRLKKATLA